jgi:hypothetical protein
LWFVRDAIRRAMEKDASLEEKHELTSSPSRITSKNKAVGNGSRPKKKRG